MYATEAASPTPGWPSRLQAIRQAIRDNLQRLAQRGSRAEFDEATRTTRTILSDLDLPPDDNWPERVLRHYRQRADAAASGASAPDAVDDPEALAAAADDDPDLLAAAGAAVSSESLSVAIYTDVTGVEAEFRRAAESFAGDHQSLGIRNGKLVVGTNAAMGVASTGEVVTSVNATIEHVRRLLARPDATVRSVALFAHGVNASRQPGGRSYLNLTGGHQITNPQQQGHSGAADQLPAADLASQIDAALGDRGRVILYACELGDAFNAGDTASNNYPNLSPAQQTAIRQGALEDELALGDTSFSDELRDLLNADGANREVWGHRTSGHTTRNRTWRFYGPGTQAGATNVFGDEPAQPGMTADEGWDLYQANVERARVVVAEIGEALRNSNNIDPQTLQTLENRSGSLKGWITRELPMAPTPFVAGDPPTVRPETIEFFERQATNHAPPP